MNGQVEVDERSIAISRSGGYYAYLVMCWLLVATLAMRGLQPGLLSRSGLPLDLLIVLAGGALTHLGYTLWWRASGTRALLAIVFSFALAAAAAALALNFMR